MPNILSLLVLLIPTLLDTGLYAYNIADKDLVTTRFVIEGKVFPAQDQEQSNWQVNTRIHVNGGDYVGFIRNNGSFSVHNVPSGSYIVEAIHPDYMYEPVRVEINSKGKHRARLIDLIQTSQVIQVPYPLRMKVLLKYKYFQDREEWHLTDFLFDHMVIMVVLPFLIIMALPKMMPPEAKEELKQIGEIANISDLPDVSEMFTNLFSGAVAKMSNSKEKKMKEKQHYT